MKVVLDTNVMGTAVLPGGAVADRHRALEILRLVGERGHEAVLPAVVVAELGVGYRKADMTPEWEEFMRALPSGRPYECVPMDAGVADRASLVRHDTGMKLADAAVVATGIVASVDLIVTDDPDFRRAARYLPVVDLRKAVKLLRGA